LHHIIKTDLKNKDVLEVGSGRGGGSNFIKKYYQPNTIIGVDFSSRNVKVSNNSFHMDGLVFQKGNAESLPFDDNSFDVVVNVESSHCYGSVTTFYKEVKRVLKPDGFFFYTDFFEAHKIETLLHDLEQSGLSIIDIDNITQNVLESMKLRNDIKLALNSKVNKLLHNYSLDVLGAEESPIFIGLQTKVMAYLSFALQNS